MKGARRMGKTSKAKKSARESLRERMVYTALDLSISAGNVRKDTSQLFRKHGISWMMLSILTNMGIRLPHQP